MTNSMFSDEALEARARKAARRAGLTLKSRPRGGGYKNAQRFQLVDPSSDTVVADNLPLEGVRVFCGEISNDELWDQPPPTPDEIDAVLRDLRAGRNTYLQHLKDKENPLYQPTFMVEIEIDDTEGVSNLMYGGNSAREAIATAWVCEQLHTAGIDVITDIVTEADCDRVSRRVPKDWDFCLHIGGLFAVASALEAYEKHQAKHLRPELAGVHGMHIGADELNQRQRNVT